MGGKVVDIRSGKVPFDIYIGRQRGPKMWRGGYYLARSVWANPYKVGPGEHTLEESLRLYEDYIRNKPELMARLPELEGKTLGCWCKPKRACHGDVLLRLVEEVRA